VPPTSRLRPLPWCSAALRTGAGEGRPSPAPGVGVESMRGRWPVIQLGERGRHGAGPARQAWETAQALAALGLPSLVFTPEELPDQPGGTTVPVKWQALPLRSVVDGRSMRQLARLTRHRHAPLLHAHGPVAHAVALGALLLGGRFQLLVRRSKSFPLPTPARPAFRTRRVRGVVATCQAVREALVGTSGVAAEKVHVVYPGVDLEQLDLRRTRPAAVRLELGISPQARLLVQVGSPDWKGWREVLAALPVIRSAAPDAHLLLVGYPRAEQREWIATLARELGVAEAVRVLPFRDDLPDILAAGELVVDAAWAGTGLSRPLLEAMALARPVVATRCGGTPELVEDGTTGLLVPPRDVATLAAAAARLLHDVETARALAAAARDRVASQFTTAHYAARLAATYRRIEPAACGSPAPPPHPTPPPRAGDT